MSCCDLSADPSPTEGRQEEGRDRSRPSPSRRRCKNLGGTSEVNPGTRSLCYLVEILVEGNCLGVPGVKVTMGAANETKTKIMN